MLFRSDLAAGRAALSDILQMRSDGAANAVMFDQKVDGTQLVLTSADKGLLGQTAATIRAIRPPEPYRGKGIRYRGENIRRKAGKAAKAKAK